MNSGQKKAAIGASAALLILVALLTLNSKIKSSSGDGGGSGEDSGDDSIRNTSLLASRSSRAGQSGSDARDKRKTNINALDGDDAATSGAALHAANTTGSLLETDAETLERRKYELAQENAFKYRKLDPEKIKPVDLTPALEDASKKYQIPDGLLAALMYVETGGTHRDGSHSMEAGYGVMNLRENNLVDTAAEAASLIGRSKEELLYDQGLGVQGAAALLARYYEDALASGVSESEAWYMAVSAYSGRPDPQLAAALADETAGMMIRGFELHTNDGGGSVVLPPNPSPVFLPRNWELVGMTPPTAGSGPSIVPGTLPPNAQGGGGGAQ